MPLIQSKSKKAVGKNIETEMAAGKPQKQSIAIALNMKRAMGKKKMANGGNITANQEVEAKADNADTKEDLMQMKGRHAREIQELVANNESEAGNSADGAKDEREMMANGGELVANKESMSGNSADDAADERDEDMLDSKPRRHKDELLARNMGMPKADDKDEMETDMLHQKGQPDQYSKNGIINYADGGEIDADSSDEDELRMLNMAQGGIAKAIMRKRAKMAEGGEVDLQDSNGDEHLNEEDQLSYQAARKKTYYDDSQLDSQPEDSNEKGDSEEANAENEHDASLVGKIRKKMKAKRLI